jgi:hypothetical protein
MEDALRTPLPRLMAFAMMSVVTGVAAAGGGCSWGGVRGLD